jgi:hypothetical protein
VNMTTIVNPSPEIEDLDNIRDLGYDESDATKVMYLI